MTIVFALALVLAGATPVAAALGPGVVGSGSGSGPAPAPPPPSFARDVAPILDRWCVSCHGEKENEGGLRLDSYEATLKGGDDGPVLIPGEPENSQLLAQVERRGRPPMPPKKRLPRDPIAVIRAWIAAGAGP